MPVGLSFLIFSTISYLIDIKKKIIEPEWNPAILSTFFLFFPKIMMGPIEKAGNVIPQLYERLTFNYEFVVEGVKLMFLGLFKKVVIADRIAVSVNFIYSNSEQMSAPQLIIGTFFFAIQLYCDFSGYSDIAVGVAKILGYNLTINFRRPYLSISIKDFWQRWHISLSIWLRDYLFLPIAYATGRKLKNDYYFNISSNKIVYIFATMVTFIICGIWHGIGWTFVVWGGIFGFYLSFDILTKRFRNSLKKKIRISKFPVLNNYIQILITFFLVNFTWIFFRSRSLAQSICILRSIFISWPPINKDFISKYIMEIGIPLSSILIILTSLLILITIEILSEKKDILIRIKNLSLIKRYSIYYIFVMWIVIFGVFKEEGKFLYFNF